MENLHVRRRNTPRQHYTTTSNVLLFGYRGLGDEAKITYQIIDSLDWPNSVGLRKGFAYPTLGKLAALRNKSVRSVRRHLAELEAVGLLTRQEQPGRPSLLIIEDPSAHEAAQYLAAFGPDPDKGGGDEEGGLVDHDYSEAPDTFVRPPRTLASAPSIQEKRREEDEINVEQKLVGQRREEASSSTHISTTVQRRVMELKAKRATAADQRAEVLADEFASVLGDAHSRSFYRSLARTVPAGVLYEVLGQVKEAAREGRVTSSPGALFTYLLGQRGFGPGASERPRRTTLVEASRGSQHTDREEQP